MIFEVVVELVLQLLGYCFWYGVSPRVLPSSMDSPTLTARCFGWFVGGVVVGYISVLLFGHVVITIGVLRILNLVAAPVLSGFLFRAIAIWRSEREYLVPRDHFWQAFWFMLGAVATRFALARRG